MRTICAGNHILIIICYSFKNTTHRGNTAQGEHLPLVVRLVYCDIGVKGNVPNWAVREKILEKFLVGGKPVPDRVFEVRMCSFL